MLETDKAYAAGFFDGEGHIEYRGYYNLQVIVTQVDRAPLDWFVILFGGYIRWNVSNKHHNGAHNWHANTQIGANFLEAVEPYLLVKRSEVIGTLEKWNNRFSG